MGSLALLIIVGTTIWVGFDAARPRFLAEQVRTLNGTVGHRLPRPLDRRVPCIPRLAGPGAAQAHRRVGLASRRRDMGTADGLRGSTLVAYRLKALPGLR
jgi:Golgi nucleoside diphosphatase